MEELEVPSGWWLGADDPDDDARLKEVFYAENTRIYKMLSDKGFED